MDVYKILMNKARDWFVEVLKLIPNFILAIIVMVLFGIAAKIAEKISLKIINKFSSHIPINRLISKIIFLGTLAVGFFISLSVLELDKALTSILAGIGIVGLALGFAFQDLAANFMSGIAIALREPFKIDDNIESNDFFGTVKRINLRTTDILTPEGQMVLIPNKDIFQNPLKNYSTGSRRVDVIVGVSYGEDLEKVKQVAINAVQDVPYRLPEKNVDLYFEEFGDSSVNFKIRVWIEYKIQKEYWTVKSEMIMKIKKAFDDAGILIPYPIRTLDFAMKAGSTLNEQLNKPEGS